MKKLIALVLILFYAQITLSQRVQQNINTDGTIEVIAYSSAELLPSDVYISFVLKEFYEAGRLIGTDESLNEIKDIIIQLGCNKEDLSTGNVYGYLMSTEDGSSIFKHKVQYILRMNTLECAHRLLESINKKSIESFTIDELDAKQTETVINKLQAEAFKNAAEKADIFLSLFNEKRGRLLEIQEIDGTFVQPSAVTPGAIKKSIKRTGDVQYYETKYNNSKTVKLEYEAKVIFEIK